MRLWHKELISVLPRQQLLSQWRECCCIARNIAENGTPNHILVNKVLDYPIRHFISYSRLVYAEMILRDYKVKEERFSRYLSEDYEFRLTVAPEDLFEGWHNDRYLTQCFYNLQEKYDCGGITEEEILKVINRVFHIDIGIDIGVQEV